MYKEFYLMQKEPFDSHPSPELFYKSNVHQTAWHYLVQGIKQQEPILVLAGEYGAGKTLLFLKLVRLMETKGRFPIVAVPSPTYNFVMILEKIVEKLLNISTGGIENAEESKLQQAVYEYFENTETRSPIYIIIDDAQEFSYSFINKLRLFASYNCNGYFPIRIIFFAHHSFLKMLRYKKLVALGQRIKRIYHLKPLNFDETKEYIYYRLIHSGATGTPVFNDDAIELILTVSGGNPRLINNVCDNCLLVAGENRVNFIDADLVYLSMEKGNLTGLKDVERPEHDPVAFPQTGPGPGYQPDTEPVSTFFPPPPPQGVSMPTSASGYPPPGYFSPTQMPQAPMPSQSMQSQPMPPAQQGPPPQHQTFEEDRSDLGAHSTKKTWKVNGPSFWDQWGKVVMIVVLALVIIFLTSYLYNQYTAEKMFGLNNNFEKKVMKEVPAYSIEREPDVRQYGHQFNIPPEEMSFHGQKQDGIGLRRKNTFKPILLTGNLDGYTGGSQ